MENEVMGDEEFLDLLTPPELKVGDKVNVIVFYDSILETKKVTDVNIDDDTVFIEGYDHAFSYETRKWDFDQSTEIRKVED